MKVIIVRGATGNTVWHRGGKPRTPVWHCVTDGFEVPVPIERTDLVPALQGIVGHSISLVGAIAQLLELDL
jgi:hypothetical protein